MRKLLCGVMAISCAIGLAGHAGAQIPVGHTDIGPTLGLGGIGSAGIAFGGRFEKIFKPLPEHGGGNLGVQAGLDYYTWSGAGYRWAYIPIGVTANYHFKLQDKKIDPFLGLGLGLSIVSCNYSGTGVAACGNSAIYLIGRAGARYFLNPKTALYADLGAGAAALNMGLMFKMR
ncbi:MAG: hypothetical protein WD825_15450 [Gemmatimonadaceae bacterium]